MHNLIDFYQNEFINNLSDQPLVKNDVQISPLVYYNSCKSDVIIDETILDNILSFDLFSTLKQRYSDSSNYENRLKKELNPFNDCQHFIIKPDLKPGSVQFKVEQMALYYVPELVSLKVLDVASIICFIKNHSIFQRSVTISDIENENSKNILAKMNEIIKKQNFCDYFDQQESAFTPIHEINTLLLETKDIPSFKLENAHVEDIDKYNLTFQKLNLDLYHQIHAKELPNKKILYEVLNRAAIRLDITDGDNLVTQDIRDFKEIAAPTSPHSKYLYLILSHNYSNPTIASFKSASTSNEPEKGKTITNEFTDETLNISQTNKADEQTLHHLIRINI